MVGVVMFPRNERCCSTRADFVSSNSHHAKVTLHFWILALCLILGLAMRDLVMSLLKRLISSTLLGPRKLCRSIHRHGFVPSLPTFLYDVDFNRHKARPAPP